MGSAGAANGAYIRDMGRPARGGFALPALALLVLAAAPSAAAAGTFKGPSTLNGFGGNTRGFQASVSAPSARLSQLVRLVLDRGLDNASQGDGESRMVGAAGCPGDEDVPLAGVDRARPPLGAFGEISFPDTRRLIGDPHPGGLRRIEASSRIADEHADGWGSNAGGTRFQRARRRRVTPGG
jgi:hypothetical protein